MGTRMLIDASHAEESRVAILESDRLEEFDFETTTKKQLKGNIYLAKVIRIEPSLQAAFVEFGGGRHGFLAFNDIHPDYYRIPVEDREALMKQRAEEQENFLEETPEETLEDKTSRTDVETLGGEDVEEIETLRPQRSRPSRHYKIQEVITRRQIMLVQVVKEERGGKGAALTTYLSLAGRYCVLMPNAMKGGGVSRKITNVADRKRLREIIESMELPDTMSLIVRTAGKARNKGEIKRDCDYLTKLWNEIREKTLHSVAPCLIYEESDLIKRAIRDYYTRDITEIWIEGEEGYKEARAFINKLMPSHLKKVKQYKDEKIPLFYRYGVEPQIDAMHNPTVQLKSGGYIVFGTTEALVAIDVNSGRATRERHIEETAFKTNLEAVEEVARQLRLRDLAGLVVIDFIDMDDTRNIEAVERRLKDSMRHDRARVQVGRISSFGLLELSRQRLRPNIIESTSLPCQTCRGSGMIRSVESSALHVLRAIEEEAIQQKATEINMYVPTAIALYILNKKRATIQNIENRWRLFVHFYQDDSLIPPDYRLERVRLHQASSSSAAAEEEKKPHEEEKQRLPEQRHRQGHSHRQLPNHRTPQAHKIRPPKEILSGELQEVKISTEEHSTPLQATPAARKPRKRFRKFDRTPRHQRNPEAREMPSSATAASSSGEAPPLLWQVPQQDSPPSPAPTGDNNVNENKVQKEGEKKSPSGAPKRKKVVGRKGWWQRLME